MEKLKIQNATNNGEENDDSAWTWRKIKHQFSSFNCKPELKC